MNRPPEDDQAAAFASQDATSIHLRRARAGDAESLSWIVARLSPLLKMQAAYRIPAGLARLFDPEDLVNEVWAVALPKLAELKERESRCTPVLLKFLGTTLLHRVNQLIVKHVREEPEGRLEMPGTNSARSFDHIAAQVTSALSAAQRDEARMILERALAGLGEDDREIIVLRGIEQIPNEQAARLLDEGESTVAMRYGRALAKLRVRIPGSILDELPD